MGFDDYYKVGGTVSASHSSYVVRDADTQILELLKSREYCFVFNSRQMGKSSLGLQTRKKLEAEGIKCVSINLSIVGSHIEQEKWYKGFASELLDKLEIDEVSFDSWWNQNQQWTEVQLLSQLIDSIVLEQTTLNVVVFLDEFNSLLNCEFKDDFLAFIRACYNQRAEQAKYERLTFCLLGVVTPGDLTTKRGNTPFNIGQAIELTGFSFKEAKNALVPGLKGKVEQPEAVLQQILTWTGGQPFLTQKLCSLIVEQTENSKPNIDELAQKYIVQNWGSQDEPVHLRSICDYLLRNEQKAVRLLGLYQQVLNSHSSSFQGEVSVNESDEQTELRLSGLVVKKNGYLKVYNPIYQMVFHHDWVKQQLDKLRPYSQEVNGWLDSNRNPSWLLCPEALQKAQEWARDRSLSDLDYQFFDASQKVHFDKVNEAQAKANRILAEANQKAKRTMWMGGIVALVLVVTSLIGSIYAWQQQNAAWKTTGMTRKGNDALQQFRERQLDSLLLAMQTGQNLKNMVKGKRSIAEYPTIVPLSALLNILVNIQEQNSWEDRQAKFSSVSLSPDGNTVVAGSDNNTIKRWKQDGTPLASLIGHKAAVTSVSFSPDGKTVTSGSDDKTVKLWQDDEIITTFVGHERGVNSVSFSPNGDLVASGSDDGTVKIWKRSGNGEAIATFRVDKSLITCVSFSPEGKFVAAGTDKGIIKLWQLDGTEIATSSERQGWVTSISFSPKEEVIATGSNDGSVRLWKWSEKSLKSFNRQGLSDLSINSVSFSPDGETLAFGGVDQTIQLWNWKQQNNPYTTLTGHKGEVTSVSFSSGSNVIASATNDGNVKLWRWKQNRDSLIAIKEHSNQKLKFNSVSFNRDSKTIASATNKGVAWQRDGTKHTFTEHKGFIASAAFSSDKEIVALGTNEGNVKLFQPNGTLKATLPSDALLITSISFSPDGKFVAAGSDKGTIQLWQLDGTKIANFGQHEGWVTSVSFSPDGNIIASGSEYGTIQLWRRDGTPINTSFSGHQKQVNSISFSGDGKTIASGSADRTIKLWKPDGTSIATLNEHSGSVNSVSFSPDGKIFASASEDRMVKLWKRDGSFLSTLTGHNDAVTSATFSPDGKMLVSGSKDGAVILWSLNLDNLLAQGCTWLRDYFVTHPDKLKQIAVCDRQ